MKEEEISDPVSPLLDSHKANQAYINTEVELMYQSCDKVIENIKAANSVIMFKDIKTKLKIAQNEINKIKRQIAHNTFMKDVKFTQNFEIDQQDKEYLTQQFMVPYNIENLGSSFRILNQAKKQLKLDNFPYQHMLSGAGNYWNFDVWFLYNSIHESACILGKYFFQS